MSKKLKNLQDRLDDMACFLMIIARLHLECLANSESKHGAVLANEIRRMSDEIERGLMGRREKLMNDIQNLSTTFSNAKEEMGLSLKEIGDLVSELKAKYGEIQESCLMCETTYKALEGYWRKAAEADESGMTGWGFQSAMGMCLQYVSDEDALLIPELGTKNILIGSRLDVRILIQYINLLKEKAGG